MSKQRETVLILDFGSQYTQLIARRCREEGVFSTIEPWDWELGRIAALNPVGIILSGGPNSTYDDDAPYRGDLPELDKPLLGICYGMYLLIKTMGGTVSQGRLREYGRATIIQQNNSRLLNGLDPELPVWMSHGDHVSEIPVGSVITSRSNKGIITSVEDAKNKIYCVQFHPEVSHTPSGDRILRNFLYDICSAEGGWDMASFTRTAIAEIKSEIGDQEVICGLSGGVDSSVAATMALEAVGDKLRCVFVDNGLLRRNEAEEVEALFRPRFGDGLVVVDAGEEFLQDLKGIKDPELKRKRIGNRFLTVFEREAAKFGNAKFLVQGTLYPDVIESADSRGPAAVIKTHHNVGGLPEKLGVTLVEPLRYLFKDEVRKVGRELGLPESILMRHPFPGPGLAVRLLGEVDAESLEMLREADAIFIEELRKSGWYDKVSQALAVLLPVRSVGVMGDRRTYEKVVALRSVDTRDFMTADFSPLPHDLLAKISSRIANEVKGINRVVYDVTSKPPGTIEWE